MPLRAARFRFPMLPLLTAATTAACGGGGGARAADIDVARYDSAGIAVVVSSGADRPLELRLERINSLGGADDGPQSFHRVGSGSVAFDRDGAIHILDGANHRVVVFDRAGNHLRTLGRAGAGPGELGQFTLSVDVDADGTIGVYDMQRRGVVRWSSTGSVLETIAVPGAVSGSRVALIDGRVFAAIDQRTDFQSPPVLRLLGLAAADTVRLAEVAQPAQRRIEFKTCPVQISGMPAIFEPTLVWGAAGATIVASAGAAYELTVSVDGVPRRVVRRSVPPLVATPALAAREIGDSMRIAFGSGSCTIPPEEVADARGIAESVQLVKRVAVAPDGSFWVERRVFDQHDTRIDVFTADGAYTGTLPPDARLPAAFRNADEFATIENDEYDVQHVVIYRVVRG